MSGCCYSAFLLFLEKDIRIARDFVVGRPYEERYESDDLCLCPPYRFSEQDTSH